MNKALRFNRTSYALMSAFALIIGLIIYVWWPLVVDYFATANPGIPLWQQLDYPLLGIFLFMSVMIMLGADLKYDLKVILVGMAGGLVIEAWGTQTRLWTYFTFERPPLWIIPAWPIASLAIDRMVKIITLVLPPAPRFPVKVVYYSVFAGFMAVMLPFVAPTFNKSFTWGAVILCLAVILTPCDRKTALLTFAAGAGLGYFLEVWGTTRLCWTYYSLQTPPLFAVLAHGLAAVAFWRGRLLLESGLLARGWRLPEWMGQLRR